jgi:pimeloyl-ACP methyl ester carboxylesterase
MALVFFGILATGTIAAFLVYRIVVPPLTSSEINLQTFPGSPDAVTFSVPGDGVREGWFFPGLRGAPTVVLCHGYQSGRGELLTMVATLQDHQYNVFVFDFAAHGANKGMTTFGYREGGELHAAIDALGQRGDVDPARFGVWGYNLGAYVALSEAEHDPRVRALILDSVYDDPAVMVQVQVDKTGLGVFPLMKPAAATAFRWLNYKYRRTAKPSERLNRLVGVYKLFIGAEDDPVLEASTLRLYVQAPEPREQAILSHGNFVALQGNEKREYENRIASFLLLHMPPANASPR